MDGIDNLCKTDIIDTGYRVTHDTGILYQSEHLTCCAAITKLQVVQHGIVLLGKALIRILDRFHRGAHLVGIIGHVRDRNASVFRCSHCISAKTRIKGCCKACHGLHILICGETHILVCAQSCLFNCFFCFRKLVILASDFLNTFSSGFRVFLKAFSACTKQCFYAANQLLIICLLIKSLFGHSCSSGCSRRNSLRRYLGDRPDNGF